MLGMLSLSIRSDCTQHSAKTDLQRYAGDHHRRAAGRSLAVADASGLPARRLVWLRTARFTANGDLFVAQRFHRIQLGRLHCWDPAADHADNHKNQRGKHHGHQGQVQVDVHFS